MIVDISALICILLREPEHTYYKLAIDANRKWARLSAGNYLEAIIVMQKKTGLKGVIELDALLDSFGLEIIAVTAEQSRTASRAYLEYGKGNHPAKLNYGDCFAYALAKELEEPLLFKGTDFQLTDIEVADFEQ